MRELANVLLSWHVGRGLRSIAGPDLTAVISNGPVGWYLPRFKGCSPLKLHIYHGTYRAQADAIRSFITSPGYLKLKWWDSMVIERVCGVGKTVLCNSDQTRDEVERFFGRSSTTTWLPLDTALFRPQSQIGCRTALGISSTSAIGLFAGSTHPTKGFPLVERLVESMPDVHWLIAVRGDASKLGWPSDRVSVFQGASARLLPTLYGAADFVVVPSLYESFGYVVAEALACGTPVLASPGGASRLLLRDPPLGSLLMARNASPDEYAKVARRVLSDPGPYRKAVLESARQWILKFMAPENWWPRFFAATGL